MDDPETIVGVGKDIDWILQHIVGGGGPWQWGLVAVLWPIGICSGFPLLLHMFAAFEPRHRCFIPGCDSNDTLNQVDASYADFALPKEHSDSNIFMASETFDPCNMYVRKQSSSGSIGQTCSPNDFNVTASVPCESWVYDLSDFPETLTTKIDLVCDQESKRRLLGTVMMLGLMLGSLMGGQLSDRFGRKKTMLLSVMIIVPACMFGGYSPNYACYVTLRLITCTFLPCIWVSNHSMTMEAFGHKNRKSVIIVKDFLWPICQLILIAVVYNNRHWKWVHLYIGAICAMAYPCFFVLPESPRWLANNKKKEEAENVILSIAKWNRRKVTLKQREQIREILNDIEEASMTKKEAHLNPLDMLNKDNYKKTIIILFNWVSVCVGAYTLILNATKLHGNLFVNYALASIVGDLPGTIALMITMKYFSRRFNLFYNQITLGVCCLILAFIPKEQTGAILFFYLLGKCCSGAAFLLVWVITAELFPTNLRSQAVGICSTVARLFGLVSPFVAQLAMYWKPLPMLVLGLPCIVSGCLVFMMPETKGKELPQTMTDATKMNKGNEGTEAENSVEAKEEEDNIIEDFEELNDEDANDSPILREKFEHLEERG